MSQNEFETPSKPWAFRLSATTLALIGAPFNGPVGLPVGSDDAVIELHRTAVCALFSGNTDLYRLMGGYIPDPDDAPGESDHEVVPANILETASIGWHLLVVGNADRSLLPDDVLEHVGADERVIVVDTDALAFSVATNPQARDKTAHMLFCTCGDCNYRELWKLVDFSTQQALQHAA